VVDRHHPQIAALASSDERATLAIGQEAVFIPDDLTRASTSARVVDIREVDEQDLSLPYLASTYGGDVAVRKGIHGRLQPERTAYRIDFDVLDQKIGPEQAVTGHLQVVGPAYSLAGRLWNTIAAVLIRESGF
jgi:putative peptide zinc metalloprotease protein